jgi:hypothetical protein
MSALLESTVYYYKATIDNGVAGFFKTTPQFHDMEHTHICRARLRCWSETINCIRYQCTLDWHFNRYIIDDTDSEIDGKHEEYLILRILCRAGPSVTTFNKESFLETVNKQIGDSAFIKNIKDYYNSQTADTM